MDWKREHYILMAHFAELDENNIVLRVIVINNSEIMDNDGNESEEKGILFCNQLFQGKWIQTSYNARFRGKYAGVGDKYDPIQDIFIAPQPFPSWISDGSHWKSPVSKPEDGKLYLWNEMELNWVGR